MSHNKVEKRNISVLLPKPLLRNSTAACTGCLALGLVLWTLCTSEIQRFNTYTHTHTHNLKKHMFIFSTSKCLTAKITVRLKSLLSTDGQLTAAGLEGQLALRVRPNQIKPNKKTKK